jgi:hypothetical protein
MAARIIKSLGLIIGSFVLAFIPTYVFAELLHTQMEYLPFGNTFPFVMWAVLTLAFIYSGRTLIIRKPSFQRKDGWKPPAQIRDSVINKPQFVGRLDREKGLLETTARMVTNDGVLQKSYFNQNGVEYTIIRFRGELLDKNGSPLYFVPVYIGAKNSDWIGEILGGDRVRVEGKFERDGILHSDMAFNFSTNSHVGNQKN